MNLALPDQLSARLKHSLPGRKAQARFQPELSYGRHFGPAPSHARPAAVLALLYPHEGQWHLPLTLRPAHMVDHAGQISLPGGLIEPGETSEHAALRELDEELGVSSSGLAMLGQLSEIYLFNSNYRVSPWLAAAVARPTWAPNPAEVDDLLEIPLVHLLDPANVQVAAGQQRGVTMLIPSFRWRSHRIWGATSMILGELVDILAEIGV